MGRKVGDNTNQIQSKMKNGSTNLLTKDGLWTYYGGKYLERGWARLSLTNTPPRWCLPFFAQLNLTKSYSFKLFPEFIQLYENIFDAIITTVNGDNAMGIPAGKIVNAPPVSSVISSTSSSPAPSVSQLELLLILLAYLMGNECDIKSNKLGLYPYWIMAHILYLFESTNSGLFFQNLYQELKKNQMSL